MISVDQYFWLSWAYYHEHHVVQRTPRGKRTPRDTTHNDYE